MRVFAYKKLKAILDLETIVCLMRTLLYGEIEIHATQCHDPNCREEYAADKGWAQEAAATDQGGQGDQQWTTVSTRRRRQASTQEDVQVTSDDPWAGPGFPIGHARKGRRCEATLCQGIIDDHTYRIYPTYCDDCSYREWADVID